MRTFVLAAGIAAANAYDESLADCETFAAQFSNTCGGTAEGNAWPDYTSPTTPSWGTTSDINCSTGSSDTIRCPNGGSANTSCTVGRKNCVTCRQDNTQVYIRYQSNGMPSHCYGTDEDLTDYPNDQIIDWEVKWNRWTVSSYNYQSSQIDEQAEVQALLCSWNRLNASLMPSQQGYTTAGDAWSQEQVAGYAFTNVAIFNPLVSESSITDAMWAQKSEVDLCQTSSSPVDANDATKGHQLHYHGISQCMQASQYTSTSVVPGLCDDVDACKDYPYNFGRGSWTTKSGYGGDVGIARDGHVIKGPYNKDGELWGCDDHDVCNGAFLSDGSYAYVTTNTFPYVVGCWGPASVQSNRLDAGCTLRTCGATAGLTVLAGAVAILISSLF